MPTAMYVSFCVIAPPDFALVAASRGMNMATTAVLLRNAERMPETRISTMRSLFSVFEERLIRNSPTVFAAPVSNIALPRMMHEATIITVSVPKLDTNSEGVMMPVAVITRAAMTAVRPDGILFMMNDTKARTKMLSAMMISGVMAFSFILQIL